MYEAWDHGSYIEDVPRFFWEMRWLTYNSTKYPTEVEPSRHADVDTLHIVYIRLIVLVWY